MWLSSISFISVGWKTKKLLKVEVDNLGYFWDLMAYVTFSTYFLARVTFKFLLSYFYSYF